MKPQVYLDPRPKEYFDSSTSASAAGRPDWVYRVVRIVLTPFILVLYRYRAIDVSNVPDRRPGDARAQPLQHLRPLPRRRAAAP